jgi:endonuclease-3
MTSKPKKKSSPRKPRGFPPEKAAELYRRLAEDRPNPKTELVFHSPFTLLVAVVLSAQSTDAGVNKATPGLFKAADTPAKMAKLSVAQVASHIKTIGFWRTKAKNVVALSKMLVEQHGGEAPHDRAALEALPGVGRKTANVMLREIWGEETIAVDTHVFRVANRTGLAPGPTPEKVEALLMEVTPRKYVHGAHHGLLLHGRYVCVARKPKCPECVIRDLCQFKAKTPPSALSDAIDQSLRA